MHVTKRGMLLALTLILISILGCEPSSILVAFASPTPTPTNTRRPTPTLLPTATNTPLPSPTVTATVVRTATPTLRPATARPPTARPATAVPKPAQPTTSPYEFHVNPPTCSHSGKTFIKGTAYLDRNDPNQRYVGAIVALGAPDGSTEYTDPVKTDYAGGYTFILNDQGERPGSWGLWLIDPSHKRKSDIGVITTNNLGPDDPKACWAGNVDFWK